MAYTDNENSAGLEALTSLATGDLLLAGDVSDSNRLKKITLANILAQILASPQITGTANFDGNTASELLALDANKDLVSLAVATYPSPTELTYVKGVTSALQTQLNAKAPLASPTFTGTVSGITATMVGLGNVDNTSDATKNASTATLINKRITARVTSETSSATPTINTDNTDIHRITALAADITSMTTNLSGTPNHGDSLIVEITGTATRTIAWGADFEASTVALPTTTDGTNMLTVGFKYNSATSKWRCLASA